MKRSSLLLFTLSGILILGEAGAQSSADRRTPTASRASTAERKAPVRLSKLFENRQALTPEVKAKAAEAMATAAADPATVSAVESAAKALVQSSSASSAVKSSIGKVDAATVLSEGAKLIESSLPLIESSLPTVTAKDVDLDLSKLMPEVAAVAPALSQVIPQGLESTGELPKPAGGQTKPAKPSGNTPKVDASRPARGGGMRQLPDGTQIPIPVDMLPNRIQRPDADGAVKPTRITAGFAAFDSNTNVVQFEENVELDHIEFKLTCDILEVELNNPDKAAKAGGEVKGAPAGPQAAAARVTADGIRRATATGYVVIEKLTAEGSQVAKSRKTVYDAGTGIVTLSEYPVLDDGKNLVRGKEAWTKILLSPDGKYKVDGPATFELVTSSNQLKPGRTH